MIPMLICVGVSSISLNDLDDVTISTPQANDHLMYNGTNWYNSFFTGGGVIGVSNWTRNAANGGTVYTMIDGDKVKVNDSINCQEYISDNHITFNPENNVYFTASSYVEWDIDSGDGVLKYLVDGSNDYNIYATKDLIVEAGERLAFSANDGDIHIVAEAITGGGTVNNTGNISIMNHALYHTWIKTLIAPVKTGGINFLVPTFTGKAWIKDFGTSLSDTLAFKGGVFCLPAGNLAGHVLCFGEPITAGGDYPFVDIGYNQVANGAYLRGSLGDAVYILDDGEQHNFTGGAIVNEGLGTAQYVVGTSQSHSGIAELEHEFTIETTEDSVFFSHSSGIRPEQIQINREGWYKISYSVNWDSDYANRLSCRVWCENNGAEISPSDSMIYLRAATYGRYGTNSATFIYEFEKNDVLELHSELDTSNGVFGEVGDNRDVDSIANECWLLIERM